MSAAAVRAIPRTTLACADCRHPALALRAMRISLERCAYADAIFFTDADSRALDIPAGVRVQPIETISDSPGYSRFMLKELLPHIATDFVQVVQWDGYVVRPEAWTDEFLDYDYIGARWWFRPEGSNVGNGGFSLRSRKLLAALADPRIAVTDPEDNAICLEHRALLESRHGVRFAPGALAARYAFEGEPPTGAEFGFHRLFNLPHFHGEAELASLIEALGGDAFASPVMVTFVQKLAQLGRKREAIGYARRVKASPSFATYPAEVREILSRTMLGLAPRLAPCPCGSGRAYRRCCGEALAW
jgi:hypothetical protein